MSTVEPQEEPQEETQEETAPEPEEEDALSQKNTTAPTRKDVGETTVYYAVEFGGNYKAAVTNGNSDLICV
jgi:hypothetical protein